MISESSLRVLMFTYHLDEDSPVLAHQAATVRAIARRVKAVHVVTEQLGRFDAPKNVSITEIARRPLGVPRRFGSLWLAAPAIALATIRFKPDICFVHMAHGWCYRIGPLLKIIGVPLLLWYSHKAVPASLRLAGRFVDRVVTATPHGFLVKSATNKMVPIGHGIDTDLFQPQPCENKSKELTILSVGRISRVKRLHLIIDAFRLVVERRGDLNLTFVGPELTADDKVYREELVKTLKVTGLDARVRLVGAVTPQKLVSFYNDAALLVNVATTGGLDKAVLEALACGCPVAASGVHYHSTLETFPEMKISAASVEELAGGMMRILSHEYAHDALRHLVVGRHDVATLADRIVANMEELVFPFVDEHPASLSQGP